MQTQELLDFVESEGETQDLMSASGLQSSARSLEQLSNNLQGVLRSQALIQAQLGKEVGSSFLNIEHRYQRDFCELLVSASSLVGSISRHLDAIGETIGSDTLHACAPRSLADIANSINQQQIFFHAMKDVREATGALLERSVPKHRAGGAVARSSG